MREKMRAESLDELKAAVEDWRSRKRYPQEALPDDLLNRARRAIGVHGLGPVVRATKIDRTRIKTGRARRGKSTRPAATVPTFSRVDLAAPPPTRPFAEVEMPTGVKVRIFTQTDEALDLLSSLCCQAGGAR
jgi:hypothetical protein